MLAKKWHHVRALMLMLAGTAHKLGRVWLQNTEQAPISMGMEHQIARTRKKVEGRGGGVKRQTGQWPAFSFSTRAKRTASG